VHSSGWIDQFGEARNTRSRMVRPLTSAGCTMSGRCFAAGDPASEAHHHAEPWPSTTPPPSIVTFCSGDQLLQPSPLLLLMLLLLLLLSL
jgi:hypothetical protein